MRKYGFCMGLILCAFLLLFVPEFSAAAAEPELFVWSEEADNLKPGGTFTVVCTPARGDIGAFVLTVDYDEEVITSVKAELPPEMKKDYLYSAEQDGRFSMVYTMKEQNAAAKPFTLRFHTARDAETGEIPVLFTVQDASDMDGNTLLETPQTAEKTISYADSAVDGDAVLLSLTPPTGTLSPEFSAEITEYALTVPFSVTSLAFDAQPGENCTVRVNRKNLGAGGSTVDFKFTVTSESGAKTVYTVAVTRGEKAKEPAAAGTGETSSDAGKPKEAAGAPGAEMNGETVQTDVAQETSNAAEAGAMAWYTSESTQDIRIDRLETAAIVLLSVAFGLTLAVLIQRIFDKGEKKSDAGKPKHGK